MKYVPYSFLSFFERTKNNQVLEQFLNLRENQIRHFYDRICFITFIKILAYTLPVYATTLSCTTLA